MYLYKRRGFYPQFRQTGKGFKRYVRYRKTGRIRQAACAGKHPPGAAARGNKPLRSVYAAVRGADAGAADAFAVRGQTAAWGVFGAMLLREDAGGYVLVAVVSFAAAVAITALCFRLRNRENQKKDGANKPTDTNRRRKANEETNPQHPAPVLHVADAAADSGLCGRYRKGDPAWHRCTE